MLLVVAMTGKELIFVFAALMLALILLLLRLRGNVSRQRQEAKRRAVVGRMLDLAQTQNEIFEINVLDGQAHKGLAGLLQRISDGQLVLDVFSYAPHGLTGLSAEIYFRATLPEGSTFYKFHTTILNVDPGRSRSLLTVTAPLDLDVGQKRTFIRVQPPSRSIRVLAFWKLGLAQPLPAQTSEIGKPFTYAKRGMKDAPLCIEDISGTGLALRFPMPDPENRPVDLDKGSRIFCLVIFEAGREERVITFWCACEVVHTREIKMDKPALILGVRFTNWAILEPGGTEISWFHCSPTHGVLPITQWVMYLDMVQRKLL